MIRYPSVAGMFYSGDRQTLRSDVQNFMFTSKDRIKVKGLISPHAGYIYSGKCAGKGYGSIEIPDRIIIFGVNHNGIGHPMAIDGNNKWNTPLGDIEIDNELRAALLEKSEVFKIDSISSSEEHSLEVQIPFIQVQNPEAKILPLTIGTHDREILRKGGLEIGKIIKDSNDDILMIASTDMSHYISAEEARILDSLAIERIKALDPDGLFEIVYSKNISMCGVSPVYMMMTVAKVLGGTKGEVIEYTNSGYASGDFDQVVGYLSAYID